MEDIITFTDLCEELGTYPEQLNSRVKRAHSLAKKGYIDFDVTILLHKEKIFIEKHNREQWTRYIYKKDKAEFIRAIEITAKHKNVVTGDSTSNCWTADSIYCYKIKGSCRQCNIAAGYPALIKECKLKKHVIKLVTLHGVPKMV